MAEYNPYRRSLRRSLKRLVEDLDDLPQSCLGLHYEGTIEEVAAALIDCWNRGDKVTHQKLSCAVRALKEPE